MPNIWTRVPTSRKDIRQAMKQICRGHEWSSRTSGVVRQAKSAIDTSRLTSCITLHMQLTVISVWSGGKIHVRHDAFPVLLAAHVRKRLQNRQGPQTVRLYLVSKKLKLGLFPTTKQLAFIYIDIIGPLSTSWSGNQYIVVANRFSEPTKATPTAKKPQQQ